MKLSEILNKIKKNIKERKPKKEKKAKRHAKKRFAEFIEKAGIAINFKRVSRIIFKIAIVINLMISVYSVFYYSLKPGYGIAHLLLSALYQWTIFFAILLAVLWLLFYFIIDMRIYQRRVGVEDVLPDFLQLTSANIRAGMPIDQALWHAIRPNFGVLAKEMEDVAKQTMSGTDLEEALYSFAAKYDSPLLQRSVSLLVEGLNAGGEIGELLDRISTNIQEAKIMKKEMSASVTTYAIFITFASIAAAPFLLALSSQLLMVIESIISSIEVPETTSTIAISVSSVSVTPSDFRIFAMVTLGITATLSACIVAIIKKGNIRAGARYIPIFVFTTILIYLILNKVFGIAMSGMF